jgi:predicted aldo/keto reductase-like oxidoreductase
LVYADSQDGNRSQETDDGVCSPSTPTHNKITIIMIIIINKIKNKEKRKRNPRILEV